jgi:hypothetical protein
MFWLLRLHGGCGLLRFVVIDLGVGFCVAFGQSLIIRPTSLPHDTFGRSDSRLVIFESSFRLLWTSSSRTLLAMQVSIPGLPAWPSTCICALATPCVRHTF